MNDYPAVPGSAYMEKQACSEPDVVERLEMQRVHLIQALKDVDAALDALNAHPEVKNIMKLVSKVAGRL